VIFPSGNRTPAAEEPEPDLDADLRDEAGQDEGEGV
jgi:hypothetical protein